MVRAWIVGISVMGASACDLSTLPSVPLEAGPPPRQWEGRRAGQWPSIVVPSGEHIRTTSQDVGGAPVTDANTLTVGQTVHVLYAGAWWHEARVLQVIDAEHARVHYLGRPPSSDGVVAASQLRVGGTITDAMNRPPLRSGW